MEFLLFLQLQYVPLLLGDLLMSKFELLLHHCSLIKLVWVHRLWNCWLFLHNLKYLILKAHLRVLVQNSWGRYGLASTGLLSE
jgi:hypothetical protein